MKPYTLALALALSLTGGAVAFAAGSPFAGTWNLNVAKSKFTGDTFTYSTTAKGMHYSNGGTVAYDFAVDGKPYPTLADRTTTWTKTADGWDIVNAAAGKPISKSHRTLSADGQKMMTTYLEYRPDGTTVTEKDVYARATPGKGLVGKWKDVSVQAANDMMVISTPAPGTFKMEVPSYKQVISGKTDGTPISVAGPTIPPGAGGTYKAVSPAKWEYTMLLNGKLYGEGVMVVGTDGKTLTDTSWSAGKATEKSMSVYEKK